MIFGQLNSGCARLVCQKNVFKFNPKYIFANATVENLKQGLLMNYNVEVKVDLIKMFVSVDLRR